MAAEEFVITEVADGVATVTINRPDKLNALNTAVRQAFISTLGRLDGDPDVRVGIAAINGFCLGGGCELALACDIRIASTNARLGQPEVNLGLIPGGGGTQRLARLVGVGQAFKLIYSGEMISADEALRIGLVEEVVAPDQLMRRARALAASIAQKSSVTLRLIKEAIQASLETPLTEGLRLETALLSLAFAFEDRHEGVRAFLEKRPPAFRGQ